MNVSSRQMWPGIALILAVGVIHLVDASDSTSESVLKGLTFYANFAGALLAAFGIWRNSSLGWSLGLLVAAGAAFVGYVISRTIGIFGLPPDAWLETLGILSLVAEGLFVALFVKVAAGGKAVSSPGGVR